MIPNDSVTVGTFLSGSGEDTFLVNNETITIVSIGMANTKGGNNFSNLKCGSQILATNLPGSTGVTPTNFICNENLSLQNLGNGHSSVVINYVNYDRSILPAIYNPTTNIESEQDIQIYGSLTAGDIIVGWLLLCILFIMLLYMLIRAIFGINTSKKYLEYSSGDVPLINEL